MMRQMSATPVLHFRCFRAVVFAAMFSVLACSNSSSNSDGGTDGSTGTGGSGGATSGTGGGGGDTGAGGSSAGSTGTGGKGGAVGTGGQTGATGGAGGHGTACGSAEPCSTGQVCVRPTCGGGFPVCEKVPDGGQCPSGWTLTGNCVTFGGPGCTPPPCTPPAPFCVGVPAACSGTATCGCLPTNICTQNGGSGSCQFANSTEITCASA
jgi:hypothetical protein